MASDGVKRQTGVITVAISRGYAEGSRSDDHRVDRASLLFDKTQTLTNETVCRG